MRALIRLAFVPDNSGREPSRFELRGIVFVDPEATATLEQTFARLLLAGEDLGAIAHACKITIPTACAALVDLARGAVVDWTSPDDDDQDGEDAS
jgi:hypothetical protein